MSDLRGGEPGRGRSRRCQASASAAQPRRRSRRDTGRSGCRYGSAQYVQNASHNTTS